MTDGDGWTQCTLGHRHWGRFGAAGLLAVTRGAPYVLCSTAPPGATAATPGACRAARAARPSRPRRRRARDGRGDRAGRPAADPGGRARRRPRHVELHDDRRDAARAAAGGARPREHRAALGAGRRGRPRCRCCRRSPRRGRPCGPCCPQRDGGVSPAAPQPGRWPVGFGEAELLRDLDADDAWLLSVDGVAQSYVDRADPTHLEFDYVRLMGDVVDVLPDGPLSAVHLGGGGCTLARYVAATRPGLAPARRRGRRGARRGSCATASGRRASGCASATRAPSCPPCGTGESDLVVADVFESAQQPVHVTTLEWLHEVRRLLRPTGAYVVNVADGKPLAFAKGAGRDAAGRVRARGAAGRPVRAARAPLRQPGPRGLRRAAARRRPGPRAPRAPRGGPAS